MGSPIGEVPVTLRDGRKLKLQFDYEALVRAEKSVPDARLSDLLPAPKDEEEERRPPTMEAVRAMIYGALYLHHPEIDQAELGRLMLPNMGIFAEAMTRGMIEAFGDPDDGDEQDEREAGDEAIVGPPQTRSTGTPSRKHGRGSGSNRRGGSA
jgi:hypothetical protein